MNLQVLVSTMHQTDHSLLEKMNIQSDVIVINQCDRNEVEEFEYRGNKVKFFSFAERGVGLSRNNALMRADADIGLFADDDVRYVDGYKELVLKAFEEIPDADVVVFNVVGNNPNRTPYVIPKRFRVRFYNCLRYGTYRIAVKVESIRKANIHFSLLFGGGAKYGCGEDSIFISDCIRKGLKVYTSPSVIGEVSHQDSTWFEGYNNKYFRDKGALFACLSKRWARLLCIQLLLRHPELTADGVSNRNALQLMFEGIREFTGR